MFVKISAVSGVDPWGVEVLADYFKTKDLPQGLFRLSECELINDLAFTIDAELAVLRYNNGNNRYLPDLDRLKALKMILI